MKSCKEIDKLAKSAVRKAGQDGILWIAYPKKTSKKYASDAGFWFGKRCRLLQIKHKRLSPLNPKALILNTNLVNRIPEQKPRMWAEMEVSKPSASSTSNRSGSSPWTQTLRGWCVTFKRF